jgi:hypothetical protein
MYQQHHAQRDAAEQQWSFESPRLTDTVSWKAQSKKHAAIHKPEEHK